MGIDSKDPREVYAGGKTPAVTEQAKKEGGALIEQAKEELLHILDNTIDSEGDTPMTVAIARAELRRTFEKFPILIPAFVGAFRKAIDSLNLDIGKISVYMVGGRLVGKPLKANSDIDIIFAFDKPDGLRLKGNSELRRNWLSARRELVFNIFTQICSDNNIMNEGAYPGKFQFMSWGEKNSPTDVKENLQEAEKALLLYREE